MRVIGPSLEAVGLDEGVVLVGEHVHEGVADPHHVELVGSLHGVGHGVRGYRAGTRRRPRRRPPHSREAAAGPGVSGRSPVRPVGRSPLDHEWIDEGGRPLDRRRRSRARLDDGTVGLGDLTPSRPQPPQDATTTAGGGRRGRDGSSLNPGDLARRRRPSPTRSTGCERAGGADADGRGEAHGSDPRSQEDEATTQDVVDAHGWVAPVQLGAHEVGHSLNGPVAPLAPRVV